MKDNKSLFQRVKLYAIPGLITCAVIVFIYVFKCIWPFGANRIDYFDNMQQVAPLYALCGMPCTARRAYGLTGIQDLEPMFQ